MRVMSGVVVQGKVEVKEALPEGAAVEVYVEDGDGFALDEASTLELVAALAEAEKREFVTEEDFWKQVRARAKP